MIDSTRRAGLCITIGLVLIVIAWIVLVSGTALTTDCYLPGDYPVVALTTLRAQSFELLNGIYSRFAFYHPGPIVFYYYALIDVITPGLSYPYGPLFLAQLILTATLIGVGSFGLSRIFGSHIVGMVAFFLTITILLGNRSSLFFDVWPPITLAAPAFCLLSLTTAALIKSEVYATAIALCVGILVSQHLGAIILVAPCVVALTYVVMRGRHSQTRIAVGRADMLCALTAALFMIVGPMTDLALKAGNANVLRLISFSWRQKQQHSFAESLDYVRGFFDARLLSIPTAWILAVAIAVLVLNRGQRRFTRPCFLLIIIILLAIHGAMQIPRHQHEYIMFWLYGLHAFAVVFSLGAILSAVRSKLSVSPRASNCFFALAACASIVALAIGPQPSSLACSDSDYADFVAKIANAKPPGVVINPDHFRGWDRVATLAVWLNRYDIPYCLHRRFTRMHGSSRVCGDPDGYRTWPTISIARVGSALDTGLAQHPATQMNGFNFRVLAPKTP